MTVMMLAANVEKTCHTLALVLWCGVSKPTRAPHTHTHTLYMLTDFMHTVQALGVYIVLVVLFVVSVHSCSKQRHCSLAFLETVLPSWLIPTVGIVVAGIASADLGNKAISSYMAPAFVWYGFVLLLVVFPLAARWVISTLIKTPHTEAFH